MICPELLLQAIGQYEEAPIFQMRPEPVRILHRSIRLATQVEWAIQPFKATCNCETIGVAPVGLQARQIWLYRACTKPAIKMRTLA